MANPTVTVVPRGTLKQVHIKDILVPARFRVDYGDLEGLAASIQDKGILQPITLSTKMELQAGGRRLQASKNLGLTTIPALVRESEGEVDLREVELIENAFRKDFTWDEQVLLIQEIDRLYKTKDFDWSGRKTAVLLNKSVGAVAQALKLAKAITVIPELKEMKSADDALKSLKKLEGEAIVDELRKRQVASVTSGQGVTRDLASLLQRADKNYRIGDVMQGLAGLRSEGVIHVIECDPPYGIDLTDNKRSKENVASVVHSYEEIPANKYEAFLEALTKELFRVAGRDSWLVFWFGPTWHTEVRRYLKAAGWSVDDIPAIWVKKHGQTMQPAMYLGRAYEPFFLCRKGNPAVVKKGRLNVFEFSGDVNKIHPTQRPVALIEEILGTLATPTSVVLCPFLGSGNTIRAAYNLGMLSMGWDLNGEYKNKFMLAVEKDARELLSNKE